MFKLIKRGGQVLAVACTTIAIPAYAALPAGVTAAITEAQTDGETLGYAYLSMAVVVGVIFWLKRKV